MSCSPNFEWPCHRPSLSSVEGLSGSFLALPLYDAFQSPSRNHLISPVTGSRMPSSSQRHDSSGDQPPLAMATVDLVLADHRLPQREHLSIWLEVTINWHVQALALGAAARGRILSWGNRIPALLRKQATTLQRPAHWSNARTRASLLTQSEGERGVISTEPVTHRLGPG